MIVFQDNDLKVYVTMPQSPIAGVEVPEGVTLSRDECHNLRTSIGERLEQEIRAMVREYRWNLGAKLHHKFKDVPENIGVSNLTHWIDVIYEDENYKIFRIKQDRLLNN